MTNWEIYKGTGEPHNDLDRLPAPPGWRAFQDVSQYQQQKGTTFKAHPEQIQLVNAALYLRRPLLITGKPGTGKTSLAYAVAHELQLGEVLYWPITTRATLKQGLYSYDAIGRLQDSQYKKQSTNQSNQQQQSSSTPDKDLASELKSIGKYVRLGPLGTALLPLPDDRLKRPRVLLIDEIDKSDIDLPNDLLHTFEEGRYRIDELERIKEVLSEVEVSTSYTRSNETATITNGQVQCNAFPFIILTSNGERDFPPPFLRRCIRLDMGEPSPKELADIVKRHLLKLDKDVLTKAQPIIDTFVEKRGREELATDQLLNAIYLFLQEGNPMEATDGDLIEKILKPLSGSGV
ncbi:AAA family ATPase [Leptothoe sp. PORK10 BA2]|uniref:AAA family ATPase n=1 Tax=Leptothoe sp. PORK10 BA2 TaxID=3110254 RepID=UPI002B20963B|nr:MoxR family ATPase [Leptothoe sp. PORK10 BA2]MEA5464239.1 MoxR family ATPase [Leptothoe sp. PORK10 BA2]